jgi:YVTN family beta-propeller protein
MKRSTMLIAGAAVVIAAGAAAASLAPARAGSPAAVGRAQRASGVSRARLTGSSCDGPAGTAYVADAGWDGFSVISTASCKLIQTYNAGDPQVPGDPGDYNYASADEAIAAHAGMLYLADTGISRVSVISAAALNPASDNPPEALIRVGLNPQALAVTPDGRQLWVADTGPQTSPSSPSQVSVIATSDDKVIATLNVPGAPSQVAFSPSGADAYVVTSRGVLTCSTRTRRITGFTGGLQDPRGIAVSPDGADLYVTDTGAGTVKVISTRTGRVTATIPAGQLPWQIVISGNGATAYVANPDSDSVSVIDTATNRVSDTISVPGVPDALALTPDGSRLWVGERNAGSVTVIATSGDSVEGSISLGGSGPQSGDGYEPTAIAIVPGTAARRRG